MRRRCVSNNGKEMDKDGKIDSIRLILSKGMFSLWKYLRSKSMYRPSSSFTGSHGYQEYQIDRSMKHVTRRKGRWMDGWMDGMDGWM